MHGVRNTWGAELHPGLVVAGEVVRKGMEGEDGYSGFNARDVTLGVLKHTLLEDLLRAQAIRRVVIVGLATDYCVKGTAIDAARLGFETTVLKNAFAAWISPRTIASSRWRRCATPECWSHDKRPETALVRRESSTPARPPPTPPDVWFGVRGCLWLVGADQCTLTLSIRGSTLQILGLPLA